MYPVVRVTQPPDAPEPLGTKRKYWYKAADGREVLFKAEERGYGEDWSEKIACELAALVGIPHVHYELARDVNADVPGVVSVQLCLPGEALVHGNTLLQAIDPAYPRTTLRVPAHTVDAVNRVVRMLSIPAPRWAANLPSGITTAVDVFSGYLMLDAWIANQDRHHENWGALWTENRLTLAPSYDHGACLARNVSDEEKAARLTTGDAGYSVGAFAARAGSRLFDQPTDTRPLSALDAFRRFSAPIPHAADAWRDRLRAVDQSTVEAVLDQVPPDRLSRVCRDFTLQLLVENRTRILAL
ncbi:MAG: phosphatidylinositol kinase [Phycisphaeraceae bacterium]|nr:MAG: phosphatidylinositol kinase [Phycisphaeraceae bacterium]